MAKIGLSMKLWVMEGFLLGPDVFLGSFLRFLLGFQSVMSALNFSLEFQPWPSAVAS